MPSAKWASTFIWTVSDGSGTAYQASALQIRLVNVKRVQPKHLACTQQLVNTHTHTQLEEYIPISVCVPKSTAGQKPVSSTNSWNTQVRAHKCKHVAKQAQWFLCSDVWGYCFSLIPDVFCACWRPACAHTCTDPHRLLGQRSGEPTEPSITQIFHKFANFYH